MGREAKGQIVTLELLRSDFLFTWLVCSRSCDSFRPMLVRRVIVLNWMRRGRAHLFEGRLPFCSAVIGLEVSGAGHGISSHGRRGRGAYPSHNDIFTVRGMYNRSTFTGCPFYLRSFPLSLTTTHHTTPHGIKYSHLTFWGPPEPSRCKRRGEPGTITLAIGHSMQKGHDRAIGCGTRRSLH